MNPADWTELATMPVTRSTSARFQALLDATEAVECHPDGYDGPCWCETCRSLLDDAR